MLPPRSRASNPDAVVPKRSPPPAPSTGAAVTATSGETLDTLPLPPEQVNAKLVLSLTFHCTAAAAAAAYRCR